LDGKLVELPVLYDGPDLAEVSERLGRTPAEVIALHSGAVYHVFAIGFRPGFPYAGYLPRELSGLPRRDSPRTRVPAGSVALVGRQTGVYPEVSPGGWHLLGRTPLAIVDIEHGHFPIRAGDQLRFVPINPEQFTARLGEVL
jgi:KipI family sensor histidine kinase inhibitor